MKHYRDEDKWGATFINMEQAFHYIEWKYVVTL